MNTHSQLNQDNFCLEYLQNKKNGYFVDIGAFDGIDLSNTYKLEKEYGWKGICVEPIKERYYQLIENRKNSICVNTCIYNKIGEIEFNECIGENEMNSGIVEEYKRNEKIQNIIKMDCITFTKLLDDANAPNVIDFLSLDTEGSELEILKSLDHNKYKFKYITIEHNYTKMREGIKKYLLSLGYKYLKKNKWDDIYIL